jgi:hypothetical protein
MSARAAQLNQGFFDESEKACTDTATDHQTKRDKDELRIDESIEDN